MVNAERNLLCSLDVACNNPASDLITYYAKGLVTPEERAEIERHLDKCETCREDLVMWVQAIRLVVAGKKTVSR